MPISQGRASIANWDLSVTFRTKDQMRSVIDKILAEEIPWNFSYREDCVTEPDGVSRTLFILDVEDMPWGNNLVRLAKIIKKYDHKF